MTSAISLLTLALSLLTAVQQNPQLPTEFRDQAIDIAQTAIVEANKEISAKALAAPQPVPVAKSTYGEYQGVPGATMPNMSIDIYKLQLEGEGEGATIYYRGDKTIASVTVNGSAATITLAKAIDAQSCINIWDGTNRTDRKCGGFMARFQAPEGTSFEVVLTAEDGSTETRSI